MKVIDVHPEELLDRELRGGLSDEQRVLLEAHLAHCTSCRLERRLRADFAAEAARADQRDMQSFVLGALQHAASAEILERAPTKATGTRGRLPALLAVACVLLMAAGAAAARTPWVERIFHATFGQPESAPRSERARKRPKLRASEPHSEQRSEPSALVQPIEAVAPVALPSPAGPSPADEVARSVSPKPGFAQRNVKRRAAQLTTRREPARRTVIATAAPKLAQAASTPVRASEASTPGPRSAALAGAVKPTASAVEGRESVREHNDESASSAAGTPAALFEQANRARRSGRFDQAAALYANLQTFFGASAEAKLSYALSARMWLDSGNAFAAHGAFERYLASGDGALRAEAMAGRALSLERLGRERAAQDAFAELLRAYPHSSYAQLAKKRLGQD